MKSSLDLALEKLWNEALSNRAFYALTFERNCPHPAINLDFFCKELRWAIIINDGIKHVSGKHLRQQLEQDGIKTSYLSSREILDEFSETLEYLTENLLDCTGRVCGGL